MKLTDPDLIRSITSEWTGERDANGRPLVPADILNRMELVTTEEAWGILRRHGYHHSFAGGWKILHEDRTLVGRAVTCRFVPKRGDLDDAISRAGESEGRVGGHCASAIYMYVFNFHNFRLYHIIDVYVNKKRRDKISSLKGGQSKS